MTSPSVPSASIVETWLQNVDMATHDDNDYNHNNDNNKRRRSISADDTAAPNKAPRRLRRNPLSAMNGNAQPSRRSILAGYKCIKALRCLADWAEETPRPWMENDLLAPVAC
ncbi:unnamed protein product [Zymoseptoria tritici ST99CH_1A5]|uniref:Uncharacterized protein n=1 Tax=Zymoseptoria tritici ST99CH_1A5 TaxID=1276529 RepID=A0A1Y6M1N3_ZYMTR|nr:unnamed protein product [Zymoseptoria tritici ST99CH_1A5]